MAAVDLAAVSPRPAHAQDPLEQWIAEIEAEINAIAAAAPALAADAAITVDQLANATWELFFGTWCSTASALHDAVNTLDHADSISPASVKPLVQALAAEVARAEAFALSLSPELCDRPDVFHVDPQVRPTVAPMTDDVDGAVMPVGALADADGQLDQFISNEIMLETNDPARVQAFLTRFGGRVIETIPAEGNETADTQNQHAIRMDPARLLDTSRLAADLEARDPGNGGEIFLASDQQTLRLLATAARAAVEGYAVELNMVGVNDDVASGVTRDAPSACNTGVACGVTGWNPNAFTWDYFTDGSVQDIEVTSAWQLLNNLGMLTNTGPTVGIVDSGFNASFNGDFPTNLESLVPGARFSASDNSAGSHGTGVANVLAGRLDNGVGAAGVAGPVIGKLVTVNTNGKGNVRHVTRALRRLNRADVKIVNMSFHYDVRHRMRGLAFRRFERLVRRISDNGALVFASAGNENQDVNRTKCGPAGRRCRERSDKVPCEFGNVKCVGQIGNNTRARATWTNQNGTQGGSNWGGDVDIWAPGEVWMGRRSGCTGCQVERFGGTSGAAPFAAGVAALVWRANSSLSSSAVWDTVWRTAKQVNAGNVTRYVYAGGAVRDALPGPVVRIQAPVANQAFPSGATIAARAFTFDDGLGTPTVSWIVGESLVGSGNTPSIRLPDGTWTILVIARYPNGTSTAATVRVTVGSSPPPILL